MFKFSAVSQIWKKYIQKLNDWDLPLNQGKKFFVWSICFVQLKFRWIYIKNMFLKFRVIDNECIAKISRGIVKQVKKSFINIYQEDIEKKSKMWNVDGRAMVCYDDCYHDCALEPSVHAHQRHA